MEYLRCNSKKGCTLSNLKFTIYGFFCGVNYTIMIHFGRLIHSQNLLSDDSNLSRCYAEDRIFGFRSEIFCF